MIWKTLIPLVVATGLVAAAATLTTQAGGGEDVPGLFAGLRTGQSVRVIDSGSTLRIETYPAGISGTQTIAEIGNDYVAVEDTKNNVVRIPVYTIKSVTIRD